MPPHIVSGEIVLAPEQLPAGPVTVVARVEDVSRADAPSSVVGEQVQTVELRRGSPVPFAIEVPADRIDSRRHYAVSVHVDVSGSGEVTKGDLLTTQSYPVVTFGYPSRVQVHVHRI